MGGETRFHEKPGIATPRTLNLGRSETNSSALASPLKA